MYLSEGGANIVYRIEPWNPSATLHPHLRGKLLRLRKDLPHCRPAVEQLSAFDSQLRPLFPPENVVQHELVELTINLEQRLNHDLQFVRQRPWDRRFDLLPGDIEKHGILVTDLTKQAGEGLVEFKPKWLAQSPNAPANSKRCRTCALRAQRVAERATTATDDQEECPLALVSPNEKERRYAASHITPDEQLQEYLTNNAQELLQTLRRHQTLLDPDGILRSDLNADSDTTAKLCKAMALRDCTLFLKRTTRSILETQARNNSSASENSVSHISIGTDVQSFPSMSPVASSPPSSPPPPQQPLPLITARLGDLDLKSPEKLKRWRYTEQRLISEGWYTNEEHADVYWRERVCLLSKRHRSRQSPQCQQDTATGAALDAATGAVAVATTVIATSAATGAVTAAPTEDVVMIEGDAS